MVTALAGTLIKAGVPERAEAVARSLTGALWRVRVLKALGQSAAVGADQSRAVSVLEEAAQLAVTLADPIHRAHESNDVAMALVTAGAWERAVTLAKSIEYPGEYGNPALDRVGMELGTHGQPALGVSLLTRCETEARGLKDADHRAWRLTLIAEGFASCGHPERAAELLAAAETDGRKVSDPVNRAERLVGVGEAFGACGDRARMSSLIAEARDLGLALPSSSDRHRILVNVGTGLVSAGAYREAEELVADIGTPALQAQVLNALAQAVPAPWARRLSARCLYSASWRHALDSLVATSPSALTAIAEEELGRQEGDASGR